MNRNSKTHIIDNLQRKLVYGPPNEIITSLNPNGISPFTSLRVISSNEDIGLTFEDLNNTGNDFNFDTAGDTLSIQSTDIGDALGSTGIQSILLQGLDTSWDIVNEIVSLNGTTSVLTSNTFLRLNGMIIVGAGSNKFAIGDVTITGDSFTWGKIEAGTNLSNNLGRFSVARAHSLTFENFGWTSSASGDFVLSGYFKTPTLAEQESGRFYVHTNSEVIKGAPNTATEMTDFWWKVKRESGGGGGLKLSGFFTGWLSKNNDLTNYYKI